MKVPMSWLSEYVDIDIDSKEFADEMTMSGSKVEAIDVAGNDISSVVVGKIISLEKHPDADRLQVSKIDIGNGEPIQVVTAAQNVSVGDEIPVALVGAHLPNGLNIKRGKLRGVESCGMMCSINELNVTTDDYPDASEEGIFILPKGFHLGMDVKEALKIKETVIDFEITSNRPDCLSVTGIAREAAATFNKPLKLPAIKLKEEGERAEKYASVEIKSADLCPRYAARIITDVKIEPSPKWMRDRLKAAGIRPVNNMVDITNYVMLEFGQPMHAFDLSNLSESKIIVRRAASGEKMETLDDQPRKLDSSMLVIADAKRPVAVAGVMGGANSEITEKTKIILFESANFDAVSVRATANKIGLRTESSSRFEKGLDVEGVVTAVDRAAQLVEALNAGIVCKGVIDCYVRKQEKRTIKLEPDKINELLGTKISDSKMIGILNSLYINVDEKTMRVSIPSFRQDIEVKADLAEEIARIYGYNKIEATLLSGKATALGEKTYKQKMKDLIKNTMIASGLNEIFTYSFASPKVFDMIRLPKDSDLRNAIKIQNPLGEDFSIMRTTTIPSIMDVIARNYNRRAEKAGLFEISYVYIPEKLPLDKLPKEKEVLTIGMFGETDFYDLKGIIEELLLQLGIEKYDFEPEKENLTFHPGRTANIMTNNDIAGILGEIHPDVCEQFEGPERTYVAILDVELLIKNSNMDIQFKHLPKFPAVTRDIAILVKEDIMVKEIETEIKKRAGRILEDIKLFDIYKGKQVPEGMKSVAYSITFRDNEKTLTDTEVDTAMKKVVDGLKNSLDSELR
ncbi:MAG: phenylalanine--tRNA ligase subunit beta [Clostridia bacterium]|jgi:phenylalanyl-tRNA synthetase beta chain